VATAEAKVEVDAGLPAGRYLFRLEVENDRGQRSKAAEAIVTIGDRGLVRTIAPDPRRGGGRSTRRRQP
jgi:hypothetical protein